jgi:CRISPR/Cas system CSM-associated protein Csm3 (group 7 of RAMP superfamily)
MKGHHKHSREITERIHLSGVMTLQTPAHLGNGAVRGEALVDMSLLLDECDGKPFIPGTTIAGALRGYLRARLGGHRSRQEDGAVALLFGPAREDDDGAGQSLLVIDDAVLAPAGTGAAAFATALRDGVRIDPKTNLAYVDELSGSGAKYDMELLEAGTAFVLHLELLGTAQQPADRLLPYLVQALEGLETGEIRLGLRKRRGFGAVCTTDWRMSRYRMTTPADLCAWLATPAWEHRDGEPAAAVRMLAPQTTALPDNRRTLRLEATFSLTDSSLLIRSGFGRLGAGPDVEQLHVRQADGSNRPVIPGTSWAGVLRHRALRIANTIAVMDSPAPAQMINDLFGWTPERGGQELGSASRLLVDDSVVQEGQSLYQTRVRIDLFTGGALDAHLFEQAPVYGVAATVVPLKLAVQDPTDAHIGIVLLLLKDLWTQDLPVGGEASVGRGRLSGRRAELTLPATENILTITDAADMGLDDAARRQLQSYVDALWSALGTAVDEQGVETHA